LEAKEHLMPGSAERVVIIGGGHNGLVAAFYLAKAGLSPVVLERREVVGGIAVTEEIYPGFRCPTVAHAASPLLSPIARDLQLERQGLALMKPEVRVFAPDPSGNAVRIYEDPERTARELASISAHDSKSYTNFFASFSNIGRVLQPLLLQTPPDVRNPTNAEIWQFGKIGWKFRGLDKTDAFRLLRFMPMAVADLVAEWFETELLRAAVAARGIFSAFAGPWSGGTGAALLLQAAADGSAINPSMIIKGGMGALSLALAKAASAAGAEIRTNAHVRNVRVKSGKVAAVVLADGREIPAAVVLSNADPKTTFLKLVEPTELDPNFLLKVQNYRSSGCVAKVNLALSSLPVFPAAKNGTVDISGRIQISPDIDYIERAFDAAKYGEFSSEPYMDITIPSVSDDSLTPKGAHVMSIHVQYAPYQLKRGDWTSRREEFGDSMIKTLSTYVPNLSSLILSRQVITPLDLERTYGLSGGHILHGEPALDQLFTFRPIPGWAQYRTPIKGLYICGSGAHPGGGITGAPGANASREVLRDMNR
jgi:phytoene dehydrogenase-like protein